MLNLLRGVKRFWLVRRESAAYWRAILLLAFLIGVAASTVAWKPPAPALVREVLPKIGEAMMIAAILAVMVDEVAKRRLLREFAIDVSSNIIGRQFPEEMREHIRDYLSLSVLRPQWTVTYTIENVAGKPGYIRLHTRTEWELENRVSRAQPCPLTFSVEKSWFPELGETRIIRLGMADPWGDESFDYGESDPALKPTLEGGMWVAPKKTIHLPPRPHAPFRCWAECVEYYRSDFSTPFVAAAPVQRLRVIVKYPAGQFKVGLSLSFEDSEVNNPETSAGEQKWDLSKPMLPGQCFFTTWQRIV